MERFRSTTVMILGLWLPVWVPMAWGAEDATSATVMQMLEKKQWGMAEEVLKSGLAQCPPQRTLCQAWHLEALTLMHDVDQARVHRDDPNLNRLLHLLKTMDEGSDTFTREHHLDRAEHALDRHNKPLAQQHLHLAEKSPAPFTRTSGVAVQNLNQRLREAAPGRAKPNDAHKVNLDEIYPPDHGGRAAALLLEAHGRGEQGDTRGERALTEEALALLMKDPGPVQALRIKALQAMAAIHQRWNEPLPALDELKRAQAMHENLWGTDHPGLLPMLHDQIVLLEEMNRSKEAEPLRRHWLEIASATFGPESPEVAAALVELGENLLEQGQAEAARQALLRALPLLRDPAVNPLGRRTQIALGMVMMAQDNPGQAERQFRRALGVKSPATPALLEEHAKAVAAMEHKEGFNSALWGESGKKPSPAMVKEIQQRLAALGVEITPDGKPGSRTRAAIQAYRQSLGLDANVPLATPMLGETGRHLPPVVKSDGP